MRTILVILLFILGVLAALAIGGGVLVLLAYAVGWLLNFVMHFDPFQITLMSLVGMIVFGVLATRMCEAIENFPPLSNSIIGIPASTGDHNEAMECARVDLLSAAVI